MSTLMLAMSLLFAGAMIGAALVAIRGNSLRISILAAGPMRTN